VASEADRAAFQQAADELYDLHTPGDFDLDALEVLYLANTEAGAQKLAEASGLTVEQAARLLKRVYGF
jgi:hypothetical protein